MLEELKRMELIFRTKLRRRAQAVFISLALLMALGIILNFPAPASAAVTTVCSGLTNPTSVAVDGSGNIYVVESHENGDIKEINGQSHYVTTLYNLEGYAWPYGVAVDSKNNIYCTYHGVSTTSGVMKNGMIIHSISDDSSYSWPFGVVVDSSGNLFVDDNGDDKYRVWDTSSNFDILDYLSAAGNMAVDSSDNIYIAYSGGVIKYPKYPGYSYLDNYKGTYPCSGYSSNFHGPTGVAVDSGGNIYVADTGNNAVEEFNTGGTLLHKWSKGFNQPYGVAVYKGNIYVADYGSGSIKEITMTPTTITASATPSSTTSGNSVTLTAGDLPSDATGTVTFTAGGTTLGTGTVSNGGASCTTSSTLAAGTYNVTATYSGDCNYAPSSTTTSFIVTIALAFKSVGNTTFAVGTNGTFIVTTSGYPTPTLGETGTLPSGVTFTDNHNGTATLSGTPAAGTAGSYPITITASNGVGTPATQSFTLTVKLVQLTVPSGISWDSTTHGKAEWNAVSHASSYSVQLKKGGNNQGSAVSVSAGTESYDFTTDIAAAGSGSYTFTVTAVGDGTNYSNSAESAASSIYNYTAPINKTLVSITTPSAITGLANGTAKTATALGLPVAVTLVTDNGNVQANVNWDVSGSSYDPSNTASQTFTVNGAVTLPSGVVNPNSVALTTSISVTVNAAQAPTYALTITAGTGGTITAGSSGNYAAGAVISLTATANSNYSFNGWTSSNGGTFANVNSASTTFTMPTGATALTATFTYNGGSGGGNGGGSSSGGGSASSGGTNVTGSVIDGTTGANVSNLTAIVTSDINGNYSVAMKADQTVTLQEPDGTKSSFSDLSKVTFSTATGTPVPVSADGTINLTNLAKGTDNSFKITYDLGNGQTITIGTLEVVVSSSGSVSLTCTLIDPYGVIIDAVTGKPIAGANVTLYYANTDRNKANGKTPDTVVQLPSINGFKPNNNQDPQTSDATGAYGFMVFPTTDYYIVATKDGYNQYTSPTISVEQEIVKWDFKMSPTTTGVTRIAGLSRVDTALAIAKVSYPGKVTNVILATADNYPDALAGSVLAYKLNAPILLVGSSDTDQEKVLDYMKSNLNPAGTVYILGGTAVVSSAMKGKVTASGFANITRLGGTDRDDTSVKIAEQMAVMTGTPLVLAYGENYPDALSISSIAAEMQYPILLVQKDGLSDAVKNEIAAIKPSKVYIIGGEGVISTAVEGQVAQITSLDKAKIVRIAGTDRYETSLAVAQYFNLSGQSVCIATGSNFPDALAGSVYAANHNAPIILADGSLPDQAVNYLKSKNLTGATIFGGESAVSKGIEQQLGVLVGSKE